MKSMNIHAIVFVNHSDKLEKSSSTVFSPQERELLSESMLEDVLAALKSSVVNQIVVVEHDSSFRHVKHKFGVSFISDKGISPDSTIRQALEFVLEKKADAALVLAANVPLTSCEDIK